MSTINQIGLNEIAEFLKSNHTTFAELEPAASELSAWASDAEFQLGEGNPASIEIPARNSVTGAPIEFTITDAGIDVEEAGEE
jgi:hypothetical protein